MHPIYKFMIWFVTSIVIIFLIVSNMSNPFIISFLLALGVSIIATKEND